MLQRVLHFLYLSCLSWWKSGKKLNCFGTYMGAFLLTVGMLFIENQTKTAKCHCSPLSASTHISYVVPTVETIFQYNIHSALA